MSRPVRKSTLWTLRKVLIRISLSMPRKLTRIENLSPPVYFLFQESLLYTCTSTPLRRNVSAQTDLGRYITQRP